MSTAAAPAADKGANGPKARHLALVKTGPSTRQDVIWPQKKDEALTQALTWMGLDNKRFSKRSVHRRPHVCDSICRKRPEQEMLRAEGRLVAAKGMGCGLRGGGVEVSL